MKRGSRVYGSLVMGSTMLQMSERVWSLVNGSIVAVSGSGTTSMSLAWMGIHPRMDDPSNPSPSSNTASVNSARGTVKCCQRPMKSMNFRSTITAFLSCAYPITSFAFGMVVASRAPRGGAHKFCACYRTLDVQAVDRTPRVALYIFVYFALDAPLVNH